MIDVDLLSEAEVAAGLRQWAAGCHQTEVAVGLLIADREWLGRDDFRRRAVWVDAGCGEAVDRHRLVGLDWTAAAAAAAAVLDTAHVSVSERRILSIAVSLVAGREHPVDLGDVLSGLDASNGASVIGAVAHATGCTS